MHSVVNHSETERRHQRWMAVFGALFLVSVGAAFWLSGPGGRTFTGEAVDDPRVALSIAVLAAVTSLLGFVSTTLLAWRKERREAAVFRFQVERQELEIERLRLELAQEREKSSKAA